MSTTSIPCPPRASARARRGPAALAWARPELGGLLALAAAC